MQPGKNPATDEVVEPLAHPALARRAGIRDAQGCGWPTMPGPWRDYHRTQLGKPCLEDFLDFRTPLHQSVVEAKHSPLVIIRSLWSNDFF